MFVLLAVAGRRLAPWAVLAGSSILIIGFFVLLLLILFLFLLRYHLDLFMCICTLNGKKNHDLFSTDQI